jgi:transposase
VGLIYALADKLDLTKLCFMLQPLKSEGRRPYASQVFIKLYLYVYLNKIRSSRRLEKESGRNIELQWLPQGLQPNYRKIVCALQNGFVKVIYRLNRHIIFFTNNHSIIFSDRLNE